MRANNINTFPQLMTKPLFRFVEYLSALILLIMFQPINGQTDPEITEINVIQKLPGPPLWQVHNGENTLWLFANITPLPEELDWDTSYVERIIGGSEVFLARPELDLNIGVPNIFQIRRVGKLQNQRRKQQPGTGLDEVISPELLQQFNHIMEHYHVIHHSILNYKPLFAARILQINVLEKSKMVDSDKFLKTLNKLRRRHNIPLVKSRISYNEKDFIAYLEEVKSTPANFGEQCLQYSLNRLDELEVIRDRAERWFQREISASEFADEESVCRDTYQNDSSWMMLKQQQLRALWLANIKQALETNKTAFAVIDIYELNDPASFFRQWLEENAYEFQEPK